MTLPQESRIVLGVSGSIAAYKAVYLARLLVDAGAEVWPVVTRSGGRFVGPLTFSAVTGHRAITDLWSASEAGEISHVELAHAADLVLVAPCTADLMARLACGRADDPLSAIFLATTAPRLIAPAMESGMWTDAATQSNLATLTERGVAMVPPESGLLASGREGPGRMAEPDVIFEAVKAALTEKDLCGQHLLVTAGPTREAFDPARFISNPSSGKMGYEVARVAARRGARVTLVSGPTALTPPPAVERVEVTTTQEMLEAVRDHLETVTVLVMAAAPADYRPTSFSPAKLKKQSEGTALSVQLESTPDILRTLRPRSQGRLVVGFAAETDNIATHARAKLEAKDLDLIVANDLTRPDAGFGVDTNAVMFIGRDGKVEDLPVLSKEAVASELLDRVRDLLER